jgi:phosphopentomutase
LKENGYDVISVGKINDIFAGRGITEHYPTHSNSEGIEKALELLDKDFCGLAFINLVDFDMLYGHRNDIDGYATALSYFDSHLPKIMEKLQDEDMLIITADHGCDPGDKSTDHTREHIPLIIIKNDITPKNLGTYDTYSVIAHTVADYLDVNYIGNEKSILSKLK